jgi:bacillopeptidase F (M6 metalloprotease family)
MSKGAYDITGQVAGWVQAPHSEAWYGAARYGQPMQDNAGHPDNPRQVAQLVVDAVDGMLVWYRDAQYTVNHVTAPIFAPPSTGSKGQLLIVDSHFGRSAAPARRPRTTRRR